MFTEIASVEIVSERVLEFEAAIEVAVETVLSKSPGFKDYELLKGVERPNVYTFIVHWEKLEDHTETFRKSDAFLKWREIIGPFFAHPPVVEHWSHIFSFNG
ncbi:MAG TPA: antibiotic biosynthesis monooxygenase family protein [Candidatus Nanopelagicaceae bacterium]|jgi:quinol monooxygenase YgiN